MTGIGTDAREEVIGVSDKERADIVEAVNNLPDDQKQFVLGYVAGVSAAAKPVEDPKPTDSKTN